MYDREVEQASLQVREPRTEEEQMRASDLLSLVLEFDDEVRGGDCKKLSSWLTLVIVECRQIISKVWALLNCLQVRKCPIFKRRRWNDTFSSVIPKRATLRDFGTAILRGQDVDQVFNKTLSPLLAGESGGAGDPHVLGLIIREVMMQMFVYKKWGKVCEVGNSTCGANTIESLNFQRKNCCSCLKITF